MHLLTTMPLSGKSEGIYNKQKALSMLHYHSNLFWLVNHFGSPVTYKYVCKQVIYICLDEKRRRYFRRLKVGD